MSEDRETPASRAAETPEKPTNPGSPVEETEASLTEVLRAVERSRNGSGEADRGARVSDPAEPAPAAEASGGTGAEHAAVSDPEAAELARREAISEVDTQLDLDVPAGDARSAESARIAGLDELPSAAAAPSEPPVRDGEIRISADHPMAALYMHTPMPPDVRGNRGAGALISLLGSIGFAVVYAGVLALWLAPGLAPSRFVDGLLGYVLSWGFAAAVAAFLVGMVLLVLVVGRAGWWAYVLGGFLVGALVWAAATAGYAAAADGVGALFELTPAALAQNFGLTVPAIAAGLVAREATVWFGAWIGGRGRRVKRRNAEALAEYEAALADAQAKQP
ncbi:hypothetical protein [Leucobacter sp. wl10]|uniref:hypothetical protein n=1 Tax=Leucobacter sp. wl10 TaxID=2304677 RepID=UPI000E5B0930|nr:hypothetical protein [Leucobacter sp. wl10]RGE24213.1 hypothetical protein D1J51_00240 [Leucobacter sp. wl10]